jgi:hypothetical protein
MKPPITALPFLAASLLALTPMRSAAAFEGELETRQVRADVNAIQRVVPDAVVDDPAMIAVVEPQRFVDDGGPGVRVNTSAMTIKGSWGRTDLNDPNMPGFMLMNFDEGNAYACSIDRRQCLRLTQADRQSAEAQMKTANAAIREAMKGQDLTPEQRAHLSGLLSETEEEHDDTPVAIEDTGREQSVAGARSTLYKATADGDVAYAWMTTELPDISKVYDQALKLFEQSSQNKGFAGRAREALSSKGLPMRVQLVESSERGPVYRSNEIVAYRNKTVDDSFVQPPAGWQIKSREELMAEAARTAHPGARNPRAPGAPPSGYPPAQLPPGVKLPPGVQLPPGVMPPQQ